MQLIKPTAGRASLALVTVFSAEVFGEHPLSHYAKLCPHLLQLGVLLRGVRPEPFMARGHFMYTQHAEGAIIATDYQTWKIVLTWAFKTPETAEVAGNINTLFARLGLSCR